MLENLNKRRIELRWTHEVAAKKSGISRAYYTNIELGRKDPSKKVMKQISEAFKMSVDVLFFNKIVPKRNTA
jgi:putative transcriptional regulator